MLVALAALAIVSIYSLSNYYIGGHLLSWLQIFWPSVNQLVFWSIYVFLAITPVLAVSLSHRPLSGFSANAAGWLGHLSDWWMGIFIYLLLIFISIDILLWLGRALNITALSGDNKAGFMVGLVAILTVSSLSIYGHINAGQIKSASYDINLNKPLSANGLSIVMVSDLHLGYTNGNDHLQKMVDGINNLRPDVVVLVGDTFNGSYYSLAEPQRAIELFRSIKSKHGIYACLGNHDAGASYDEMLKFFRDSDIKLLNDDHITIDNQIVLVGRKDSSPIGGQGDTRASADSLLSRVKTDLPIVVADHNPINIKEYDSGVDLILSGHTHQGQIWPFNYITKAMYAVDYGYYQKDADSPQVVVTSGAGTWGPPMRIGTDSEIVKIQLR